MKNVGQKKFSLGSIISSSLVLALVGMGAGALASSSASAQSTAPSKASPSLVSESEPIRIDAIDIVDSPESAPFADRAGAWPKAHAPANNQTIEARSLGDQLNSIPGVYTRESGSPTISIRGSTQADRVLKLFDGVPLNLADGLGAPDLFLPEETLGDFRIIKGPATVFYGASAMGGAVDHSLRWYERSGLRLGAVADEGHFDARSAFAVLPLRFGGGSSARAIEPSESGAETAPSRAQITAFRKFSPGDFHYTSVSGFGSGRREHNTTDLTRVTAAGEVRAKGVLLRPRAIFATQKGETPDSLEMPYPLSFEKQGTLFALDGETSLENDAVLGARASDTRLRTEYSDASSTTTSSSSRSTAAVDYTLPLASRLRVHNFVDLNYGEFSASYYGDSRFSEARTDLGQIYDLALVPGLTPDSPNWALHPSFRYMAESGDFTKALALIGEALGSEIRLTYAEGLRLPSLADRYASNQYYVGNPRLRPERSQSWEIGFRMSPETRKDVRGTGVSFEVSTFDTIFFDFIDNTSLGGLLRTKVNTGTSRARGAEFALGYATALGQVAAAYGYLDAKNVDTGESLRLAPHHQLALSAAHQFGVIVAELKDTIWSEFQDRDLTNALRTLPGWNSLDLTLRTKGLSDWEIEAGVMNILDQPREMTIGFPEPQRRYQVSAMRNF